MSFLKNIQEIRDRARQQIENGAVTKDYNVSSLPILEKGEQFPRVICILILFRSHYKISL